MPVIPLAGVGRNRFPTTGSTMDSRWSTNNIHSVNARSYTQTPSSTAVSLQNNTKHHTRARLDPLVYRRLPEERNITPYLSKTDRWSTSESKGPIPTKAKAVSVHNQLQTNQLASSSTTLSPIWSHRRCTGDTFGSLRHYGRLRRLLLPNFSTPGKPGATGGRAIGTTSSTRGSAHGILTLPMDSQARRTSTHQISPQPRGAMLAIRRRSTSLEHGPYNPTGTIYKYSTTNVSPIGNSNIGVKVAAGAHPRVPVHRFHLQHGETSNPIPGRQEAETSGYDTISTRTQNAHCEKISKAGRHNRIIEAGTMGCPVVCSPNMAVHRSTRALECLDNPYTISNTEPKIFRKCHNEKELKTVELQEGQGSIYRRKSNRLGSSIRTVTDPKGKMDKIRTRNIYNHSRTQSNDTNLPNKKQVLGSRAICQRSTTPARFHGSNILHSEGNRKIYPPAQGGGSILQSGNEIKNLPMGPGVDTIRTTTSRRTVPLYRQARLVNPYTISEKPIGTMGNHTADGSIRYRNNDALSQILHMASPGGHYGYRCPPLLLAKTFLRMSPGPLDPCRGSKTSSYGRYHRNFNNSLGRYHLTPLYSGTSRRRSGLGMGRRGGPDFTTDVPTERTPTCLSLQGVNHQPSSRGQKNGIKSGKDKRDITSSTGIYYSNNNYPNGVPKPDLQSTHPGDTGKNTTGMSKEEAEGKLKIPMPNYVYGAHARSTVNTYLGVARRYLARYGWPPTVLGLTQFLSDNGPKTSAPSMISALRWTCKWTMHQFPQDNNSTLLQYKRAGKRMGNKLPQSDPISPAHVRTYLENTPPGKERDMTMALSLLGLTAGWRPSNIIEAKIEDAKTEHGRIKITLRGAKNDKLIRDNPVTYIKPSMGNGKLCPYRWLRAWLHQQEGKPSNNPLFTLDGKKLTRKDLDRIAKQIGKQGKYTPKSFRRGMASTLAEKGVSLPIIMAAGHWRSPGMPAKYVASHAPSNAQVSTIIDSYF